jgi:predicted ArsR family transcriptional regulator
MRTAADDILFHLKTHGPTTTEGLAAKLGISREGARQHLEKLATESLIAHRDERTGIGRPRRSWSLTQAGHSRFPDTHAQFSVELITTIREEFGEDGLDRLITRREAATRNAYTSALALVMDWRERVEALAAQRSREGYMALVESGPDGALILIENHCPVCAAARTCQGLCRSELAVFEDVLGPDCLVERVEHLLSGARRCTYKITRRS